ncbi:MAG: imidazole glycerol phosphate synthase subunit HisH [Balneolaceae bacterium]|nr:MAG: imidazole glycerol phosphate synthase subunit HisH [Balneolaceae bacterium]
MIAIIDYKAGNLASVSNSMDRLMASYRITNRMSDLDEADGIIFPGVGHAVPAMRELRHDGLDTWMQSTRKPLLGICLGMQLLYESTTEGPTETLGILPGRLEKFDTAQQKVPHMGWNTVEVQPGLEAHPLLRNIPSGTHFYHVHSYFAPVTGHTVATATYSHPFCAIASRDNFMGVQFHPEKSGKAGEQFLRNFLDLVYGGMRTTTA